LLTVAESNGIKGYRFAMMRQQGKFGTGMAGRQAMKTIMMAAAMLAAIAMPAYAQMSKHGRGAVSTQTEAPKPVDEKAYNAALDRIPDSKEKYDPWGVARPVDSAKKPK
jgi:hypothetical protein